MTVRTFLLSLLLWSLTYCSYGQSDLSLTASAYEALQEALDAPEVMYKWLTCVLFIIALFLSAGVLYLRSRNKSQLLQLNEAFDSIATLRRRLNRPEAGRSPVLSGAIQSTHDIRAQMRDDFLSARNDVDMTFAVSPVILESEAYEKLQQYIKKGRIIPEKNPLWDELEDIIVSTSPDFKYKLHILTGGKLKPSDFHLAMLIRCGISPTNMAVLVGRAKATIAYRREALGQKVFDRKLGVEAIDRMIRSL